VKLEAHSKFADSKFVPANIVFSKFVYIKLAFAKYVFVKLHSNNSQSSNEIHFKLNSLK